MLKNKILRANERKVKIILGSNMMILNCLESGYLVTDNSPFGGTSFRRFKSLVQVVDYYKPRLRDAELTAMYNGE